MYRWPGSRQAERSGDPMKTTVVLADWVVTGLDEAPIENGAVLVAGPTILGVGPRESLEIPGDADVVDCRGMTLLPGLVDCHDHLLGRTVYGEGTEDITDPDGVWAMVVAHHARRCLDHGVTTVRVPGTHHGIDLDVRKAASEGYLVSPRLLCAGEAITMTGGHGQGAGIEVDGVADCLKAARSQLAKGADFLKVMASGGVGTVRVGEDPTHPELTVEELRAVVSVADAARKYVTAHADGVEGIENALRAGVHCIEHGIYLTDDQARRMASDGVRLVPTLSTMVNIARKGSEWDLPAEWIATAETILAVHRESFQNALDAGVLFGTGTDGYGDLVDEIVEFTSFGVSPMRAIQAATRDAAQIASPGARFGVLSDGFSADMIAVSGDPLTDLEALRAVRVVFLRGERVSGSPAG